jgi:hypothetical protein
MSPERIDPVGGWSCVPGEQVDYLDQRRPLRGNEPAPPGGT